MWNFIWEQKIDTALSTSLTVEPSLKATLVLPQVKKNQQRAVMILESKNIPFTTIDITDPGQEDSKEYMNENAKPKGSNKVPVTPQIFNEAEYCGVSMTESSTTVCQE